MQRRITPLSMAMLLFVILAVSVGALSANGRLAATHQAFLPLVRGEPASAPTGDLLVQGRVYERLAGPLMGIAGATVWITSCVDGWTVQTTTMVDGAYVLVVPEVYVGPCETLVLGARAEGFQERMATLYVDDLFALPHRDIGLVRQEATPTPTTEVGGDLTIYGTISDCGGLGGTANALVSADACSSLKRRETLADANGAYALTIPAGYLDDCDTLFLYVGAVGYAEFEQIIAVATLRANPEINICLTPDTTLPPP